MKNFQLTPFKTGEPLLAQLSAERMNAILDAIDRTTPIAGRNSRVVSVPGGKIIHSKPAGESGALPNITFIVSDASTTEGDPPAPVNKVLIADGKINGEFPSGMGFGNYILTIAAGDIWAGLTFDPDTLEITSRFLDSGTFPAPPAFGTVYIYLGFVFTDVDGKFQVRNTYVGDINFELIYGAHNGLPALLPVQTFGTGWFELPEE